VITFVVDQKERYLVALRAGIKGTGLLEKIRIPREEWVNAGDKQGRRGMKKIGQIKKKYGVTRSLITKGKRKGKM
jgi:hypothetical protein